MKNYELPCKETRLRAISAVTPHCIYVLLLSASHYIEVLKGKDCMIHLYIPSFLAWGGRIVGV